MSAATSAAEGAAESVRALNHATLSHAGYAYPSEVYDVAGSLESAAARMVQAIEQATVWLEREQVAGRLRHDDAPDAGATAYSVIVVLGALVAAQQDAARLAESLNECHRLLGAVGAAAEFSGVAS